MKFLPADAVSYDDASNNRALISGKSALIWNPPSAWAVAKRDAPQIAADCWAFPGPRAEGPFTPAGPWFWGIWQFSRNKTAAKELITWLAERPQVEERCTIIEGFDVPPFDSMTDFKVWETVEPPKGTLYSSAAVVPGQQPHISGYPAPPALAVQIYQRGTMPTMLAKLQRGESIQARDRVGGRGTGGVQPEASTFARVCALPSWPAMTAKVVSLRTGSACPARSAMTG